MSEKLYYRFKELLQNYNITTDELLYQVENYHLKLSFIVESQKLVVGKYSQGNYNAFGIGCYSGPVSVDRATSIKLFATGKAKCTDVFVRMNRFGDYSSQYPFDANLPDRVVNAWHPTNPIDFGTGAVIGKLNPRQGPSGAAAAREILSAFSQFAQDNNTKIPSIAELNGLKDEVIYTDDFKFSIEQACVMSSDLKRVGLLGQQSASKPHYTSPHTASLSAAPNPNRLAGKPKRSVNQINALVKNLIGLYPTKSAAALWKILQDKAEDNDLIDPTSILDEVGESELYWTDSRGNEKRLAYKTFRNKVSEFK